MREKLLEIDTGLVCYHLNSDYDLIVNPTDTEFVRRLYEVFNDLDKKQEGYKTQIEKMANKAEIFDFARERDREMREMIDTALGGPVSDAVFKDMNVYALADGLPVWVNLIFAIMDELDTSFTREQKLTNPRIKKYTAKYEAKYHK